MDRNLCASCGKRFTPRHQVPHQTFCSSPGCQQERRRQWLRNKLKLDPDYQANQINAQKAWCRRHPEYWCEYRKSHPKYVEHNRALQLKRNTKNRTEKIAKMDASKLQNSLSSGLYQLTLVKDGAIAKMNVWIVEITVLDSSGGPSSEIAKIGRVR